MMLNSPPHYPPEEPFVVQLLVGLIKTGKCWKDITDAADAIFHARLIAGQMRREHERMNSPQEAAARTPVPRDPPMKP